MNRLTWILAVCCLLTIGVSQQGSDPGLGRAKEGAAPAPVIQIKPSVQIPTPKDTEVVVIFLTGDYIVLTQGQSFSVPNGESFRTAQGAKANWRFRNRGEASGNFVYEVIRA